MQMSMFSSEERPVSPSASPGFDRDFATLAATSPSPTLRLLTSIAPAGWFGRTSPEFCPHTAGETSAPSSGGWQTSGMGGPTGFLTLSSSDWPNDASVCSLSDVLETGPLPPRYFLSPRAARGILRRAANRAKDLPAPLKTALEAVAGLAA